MFLFNFHYICFNKIETNYKTIYTMTALEFSYSVAQTSRTLKPFAMRLTRDSDDANDLLQDTVLKAFTYREKFTDGTNLKAWLYTIMKNTFITNYQKLMRKKTFVDSSEDLLFLNSVAHSTQNTAYSTFALNDINKAMATIEEAHSVPFMMYYKGFKYHEIAEKLNIPIGTVKNRIHLARKQLKTLLSMYR